MSTKSIDIGFVEEKSNWLLHPRFFPSKIGGKPAWLDLKKLPHSSELVCKRCKEPLIFLGQVYAPFEESSDCFHRTIFIFICQKGACCKTNSADNFIVLRCQLPRKNDYYSYESYEENENETFPLEKWAKLCNVCGVNAPSHCSKCKKVYYCCRQHQILDWQKGHKAICPEMQKTCELSSNNFAVTEAGLSLLFKEWELIVDEEDEEDISDIDPNQEMIKFRKLMQDKKIGTLSNVTESELEQYISPLQDDKIFDKFSKRIARYPDQVLRYDRGGAPLWITGKTGSTIHVPKCQYCNSDRQFEFQIMPQLLNFINVGTELNGIDWGVLVIYTCKASCTEGPAYKEEFIYKQDLTNETI